MDREKIVEDLFDAVSEGSLEKTKELLNSYGLADFPALSESYNLLLTALYEGQIEIAELFLSSNCRVNPEDDQRGEDTPLHVAAQRRETKIVQTLLDRQADVSALNQCRETPLMKACQKIEPRFCMNDRQLPDEIIETIAKKEIDVIELLIKSGADVNVHDINSLKPLHYAIDEGDVVIMEILLKNHADPNATGDLNESLLTFATSRTYDDPKTARAVFQLLLNHGADSEMCDIAGRTALHSAVCYNNFQAVEILIDNNADINARDYERQTPLHYAAEGIILTNEAEVPGAMVYLLLERGAAPNVYDEHGRTPFYNVVGRLTFDNSFQSFDECRRIVDIFLTHGADINGSTVTNAVRSHSPLKSAVAADCSAELITYLISRGADVNPETDCESSPLYHAAKNGNEATLKLLLDHGATTGPEGSESILQIGVESRCLGVVEQIFRSFYANNENCTHRIKMTLSTLLAERFFERLRSWFKYRAGKNTGITVDQYKKIVRNFLQDAYTYETKIDTDRDLYSDDDSAGFSGVEHIMKYDCDVDNSTSEENWREARIVMMLLSNGIDIDFRDHQDRGSLCYAIKYGDVEITRLCLTVQTKVDTEAINVAVAVGSREMVRILLKHDPSIDVNARVNGVTPLICATMGKKDFPFIDEPDLIVDDDAKDDLARLLVARGADVNARAETERNCQSVLLNAAQNNRVKLVTFLMRLNRIQPCYNELFHVAVKKNQLDVVKLLLAHGTDVDLTNDRGKTAFRIACIEGHIEMVEFLLNQGASTNELEKIFLGKSISSEVHEVIERHALRIIGSTKSLSEGILRQIDQITSCEMARDLVEECRKEAAEMRNEKIGDSNICFYDIFEKGIDQLTMYARNESIRPAWESRDLARDFPMHYKWMNINFLRGLRRASLLDFGTKVIHSILGWEFMPEVVIDYLFGYLDDMDIRHLVEAGSNYSELSLDALFGDVGKPRKASRRVRIKKVRKSNCGSYARSN